MGWMQLIKIGIPFVIILSIGIYITMLKNNVARLEDDNQTLMENVIKLQGAFDEQRAENDTLRTGINKALAAKNIVDMDTAETRRIYEEIINGLFEQSSKRTTEALENSYLSGNRFNDWFVDWMQRVSLLGKTDRDNQNGEGVYSPRAPEANPSEPDRAIIITLNSKYAEQMAENCDNSKFGEDGLVDEELQGDPRFCNWFIVGFPGESVFAFQAKMEEYYVYMKELNNYGDYYKQATTRFKGNSDGQR